MNRLAIDQQVDLMEQGMLEPFSRLWLLGEDGRYFTQDGLSNAYDDAMSAIIEGHDDGHRAKILEVARQRTYPLIDRITAELAVEACCDPLTAMALAIALDRDAIIEDAATDELVMSIDAWTPSDDGSQTVVWVSPGVLWHARGELLVALPETAMAASVGRRLRDVVGHPVLDRHPLTITGVTEDETGRALLVTDAVRTAIGLDELAAMRPPGAIR